MQYLTSFDFRIDQQQLLQAQQNAILQQQFATDEKTLHLLHLNQNLLQQARMSPSLMTDDPNLLNPQQNLLMEQTIPQQIFLDQSVPQQMSQNVMLSNQQQIGLAQDFINHQMKEQILQQQIQNQNFMAQQAIEKQLSNNVDSVNQINQGSSIDPSLQQLQNVLTQIIHNQDQTNHPMVQKSSGESEVHMNNEEFNEQDNSQNHNRVVYSQGATLQQPMIQSVSSLGYGSLDSPNLSHQNIPSLAFQINAQKQQQLAQQAMVHQQLLAHELLQQAPSLNMQQLNSFQQQQLQIAQQELQIQAQQQLIDRTNLAWLTNQNHYYQQQGLVFDQKQTDIPIIDQQQIINTLELQQLAQQQQLVIQQQQQLLQQQQFQNSNTIPLQNSINPGQNFLPKIDPYQQQQLLNIAYPDQQHVQLMQQQQQNFQQLTPNVSNVNQQIAPNLPQQVNHQSYQKQTSVEQKPESLGSSVAHTLSRTSSHEGTPVQNLPIRNVEETESSIGLNNDISKNEQFMTPMAEMPEELVQPTSEIVTSQPTEGIKTYFISKLSKTNANVIFIFIL